MPSHSEHPVLPFTPQQLFDLVADVEKYPQFLPWCRAARIIERKDGEMLAELVVSFSHMTESYTSRVLLQPPTEGRDGAIDVTMVKGPFAYLINRWRFIPQGSQETEIDFFIDFKFKSRILDKLIGALFAKAAAKMVSAFTLRAESLYK